MSGDADPVLDAQLAAFAAWVPIIAARQGLGMIELQAKTGLARATFFAAVKGRGNPTLRTLAYIADALERPLWALLMPPPGAGE